jgi:hydroxymethylbilane synthase
VGTRGSLLARAQTQHVVQQIQALYPTLEIEVQIIQTTGDARQNIPFAAVGTKGMFVKEIEQALLENTIDLGVHSLKDMPGELPEGLSLVCFPPREDPRDALLSHKATDLESLPQKAVVGTSSLRRKAQLLALRPDLNIQELRGNLDTRLRKLDSGEYDATVLACAGLNRLGFGARITHAIASEVCCPAVGQGALALEARTEDTTLKTLLAPLNHAYTEIAVCAERAFLLRLQGGCSIPAGAYAHFKGERLAIQAVLAAPNGTQVLKTIQEGHPESATELGIALAEDLLNRGGELLLKG